MFRFTIVTLLFFCVCDSAEALTDTVLVYNGGKTGYDANAEGYAWQTAGFLDANGKPLSRNANGDIVDSNNNVVGQAIKKAGKVIGWKNSTKNVAIYDINQGTLVDAYNEVAVNGTLEIIKHGLGLGGVLRLDNGNAFSGFGTGTGRDGPVYALPDRQGANITMNLTVCWSAKDPDGDNGPQKSVQCSATTVNGIDNATGDTGIVKVDAGATPVHTIPNEIPENKEDDFSDAVNEAVSQSVKDQNLDGHTNLKNWVDSKRFLDRYSELIENFVGKIKVNFEGTEYEIDIVDWKMDYSKGTGLEGGQINMPQRIDTSAPGGSLQHETYTGTGPSARIDFSGFSDLDVYSTWEDLFITQHGELPETAPDGLTLLSGIFSLITLDGLLEEATGCVSLDYSDNAITDELDLYMFDDGNWNLLDFDEMIDETNQVISADFLISQLTSQEDVFFAAFGEAVPEPASICLLLTGVLAILSIRFRRNK